MWGELPLERWVQFSESAMNPKMQVKQARNRLVKEVLLQVQSLRGGAKNYEQFKASPPHKSGQKVVVKANDHKVLGDCPVYSDKLVCCGLKTIDVVQNCGFGCSYCTIQTFYGDEVSFDGNLVEKLIDAEKSLDMNVFQHIGTGQSSDSLMWGNKNGVLKDLCDFASRNSNVLLEFKTKSANVRQLLSLDVPKNVVCAWSLNTQTIVDNEEHFTASLEKRIAAAKAVADAGIKVAFHFHPIVYYDGWDTDYPALAKRIIAEFDPDQVLFVSMGSVTFIKPVMQQIRSRGHASKILQMDFHPDPHGKLSYSDEVKVELFKTMYAAFKPWRNKVFQYLCMERAYFWDEVIGWAYPNNDHFSAAFAHSVWRKIYNGDALEKRLSTLKYDPIEH